MKTFKLLILISICFLFFASASAEGFKRYLPLGYVGKHGGELFFDTVIEKVVEYDATRNVFIDAGVSKEAENAIKKIYYEVLEKTIMSVFSTEEGWKELESLAMKEGGEIAKKVRDARKKAEIAAGQQKKDTTVDYTAYLLNKLVDKKYGDRTPENYKKAIEDLRKAIATGQIDKLMSEINSN